MCLRVFTQFMYRLFVHSSVDRYLAHTSFAKLNIKNTNHFGLTGLCYLLLVWCVMVFVQNIFVCFHCHFQAVVPRVMHLFIARIGFDHAQQFKATTVYKSTICAKIKDTDTWVVEYALCAAFARQRCILFFLCFFLSSHCWPLFYIVACE